MKTAALAFIMIIAAAHAEAAPHAKPFWRSIAANGYAVPDGEKPAELVRELTTYFSSPDPELRDDIAYSVIAQWVYRKQLFTPDELKGFIAKWTANLREGFDDRRIESVLRRSFSALALSTIAALDNEKPFLEKAEFDDLLDRAIAYLHAEHDLRGFDDRAGWIHATAHTADLLKFLARSRHLTPDQQRRVFAALSDRLTTADVAFTHGEDERLARVALSLVARSDANVTIATEWLQKLTPPAYAAEERVLIPRGNITHFLYALYTLVATDSRLESDRSAPFLREVAAAIARAR